MKHIISFSGGKDSTAMLLLMIENKMQIDEIIFCDTGKEFPAMYIHIKKVEKYINRKITILKSEKTFEYWIGEHIKTKGKNIGKIGYGWMDMRSRWCTSYFKRNAMKKYLKSIPHIIYQGIAYDEPKRIGKNNNEQNIKYPLYDMKITEKMALEYCYSLGFNWDGLYNKFARVSCYCCPLQRLGELYIIYNEFPELWKDIKKMDKTSYRKFRSDYSLDELENKFNIKKIE